ncbi:MAG: TM2 domain-containing protein [Phycisphaerales bacterium]|nr:TM2 domain-containing protein [Phycisphaerales bacterium]
MESQSSSDAGTAKDLSLRPCHNCLHPCLPGQARCPECGEPQPRTDEARPSPGVAGVLSFLIPGLGHFYLARPICGIAWLFVAPIVWWWADSSIRGSMFFSPNLQQESWKGLGLRGAVLLYHALAAVHAIHQGQPRHDTQRGRTARRWLLRLGLAGIASLFIYTYGVRRFRDYWAWAFPVTVITNPAAAPIAPPPAPKPFFGVRIVGMSFLPNGDLRLTFNIQNTSPWTIERGTLHVKSADGRLYGSIPLAYMGIQKQQKSTVMVSEGSGKWPTGFSVEAADILTIDGLKECIVAHDGGCVVLRLISVEPLEDGRSLATFEVYNMRSTDIPIGSRCAVKPVWVEKTLGGSWEVLVLPAIPAGGVGQAKLAFQHALEGFEPDSGRTELEGPQGRLNDARILKYEVEIEGAPVENTRGSKPVPIKGRS